MFRRLRVVTSGLAIALLAATVRAEVLNVPEQFPTIQAAVDAAQGWDLIVVAPGTYRENVVCEKDQVSLWGSGATIDGQYNGPCLVMSGSWLYLSGFTLVNGHPLSVAATGEDDAPGGGLILTSDHATAEDLTVRACDGSGIECSGQVLLVRCTVEGCTGPGIRAVGTGEAESNVLPYQCVVRHCSAGFSGKGGAFHVSESTFEGNRGAGITFDLDPCDPLFFSRFQDNTIIDNGGPGLRGLHLLGTRYGAYADYRANRIERNEVGLTFKGLKFAADHLLVRENRAGGLDVDSSSFELNDSIIRRNGRFGLRSVDSFGPDPVYIGFGGLLWNVVRDNAGDGMHLIGGRRGLQGNLVKGNLGDGVSLEDATEPYTLNHNHVLRNGHDGIDNSAIETWLQYNTSKNNGGADIAGAGDGNGNLQSFYANVSGDGTGEDSLQELELDTLSDTPGPESALRVPSEEYATIQAAVDAAVEGDVVFVAKGLYRENVSVTTAGITLKGKGIIDGGYAGACLTVAADDITVAGLTLVNGRGSDLAASGAGAAVTAGGLQASGNGLRLVNLKVRASSDFGVSIAGNDGVLQRVRVEGCELGLSATTLDPAGGPLHLTHCLVTRCGSGFTGAVGPFVLEGNTFAGNRGDGINIALAGEANRASAPTAQLVANRCLDNSDRGIVLADPVGGHSKVWDNVCSGNGVGMELSVLLASVVDNSIERNRSGGVFLAATSTSFQQNKVSDNGLVGVVVTGLLLQGEDPFGGNDVSENALLGNAGDGLDIASLANDVANNTIEGNFGDGVQLAGGTSGNTVRSNEITGNGHDGLDNAATETLIKSNICTDNGGADLAGLGAGSGTTDAQSTGNVAGDGTGLQSLQELELATLP